MSLNHRNERVGTGVPVDYVNGLGGRINGQPAEVNADGDDVGDSVRRGVDHQDKPAVGVVGAGDVDGVGVGINGHLTGESEGGMVGVTVFVVVSITETVP